MSCDRIHEGSPRKGWTRFACTVQFNVWLSTMQSSESHIYIYIHIILFMSLFERFVKHDTWVCSNRIEHCPRKNELMGWENGVLHHFLFPTRWCISWFFFDSMNKHMKITVTVTFEPKFSRAECSWKAEIDHTRTTGGSTLVWGGCVESAFDHQ